MRECRYTLLADGSSDRVLLKVIRWLFDDLRPAVKLIEQFADGERLPPIRLGLGERVSAALQYFPCELLFIHRDAEKETYDSRKAEIDGACAALPRPPHICVIPVRMQEAWLLTDEAAIRQAAGNPNGTTELGLPPVSQLESLPDPKETLHKALRAACELNRRGQRRFNPGERCHRVAECTRSFAPLRQLPAFQCFERDLREVLRRGGWLDPGSS